MQMMIKIEEHKESEKTGLLLEKHKSHKLYAEDILRIMIEDKKIMIVGEDYTYRIKMEDEMVIDIIDPEKIIVKVEENKEEI